MSSHFTSFTPEGMRAFRQTLSDEAAQRRAFVQGLFSAERKRRHTAAQNADTRRLFVSELRSGVHALRSRFELARRDMVADFQQMASELQAARKAFQNRSGFQPNRAARTASPSASPRPHATEPAAHQPVHQAAHQAVRPAFAQAEKAHAEGGAHAERSHEKSHDDKPEHAKKRHG
jgi:hypothetical protein